jgi:hypothetical protein
MTAGPTKTETPILERYRYVFVVTYGRSGSTLLQSVINSTRGTQIRGENRNILYNLYKSVAAANRTLPVRARSPEPRAADHPWFGFNEVRAKRFDETLMTAFVRDILTPDPVAKVIGFKEIRYTSQWISDADFAPYMTFLLSRFPQARIVFNSRRPEDVVKSSFMAKGQPDVIARLLRETDQRFAAYDLTSDRTIHMQYEDYVADHSRLHKMLDFLELDWTAEAVEAVMDKRLTHASHHGSAPDEA